MRKLQGIMLAAMMLLTIFSAAVLPAAATETVGLIANGNFEADTDWTLGTGLAISAEGGKTGNGLVLDVEVSGASIALQEVTGLEAGETYTLSFDYKIATTPTPAEGITKEFGLRYILREGTGGSPVGGVLKVLGGEAGDWITVTADFTVAAAPETTPTLQFYMFQSTAGKVYVDNVSLTEKVWAAAKTGNLVTNGTLEETAAATDWSVVDMDADHVISHAYGEAGAETVTKVLKLTKAADATNVPYVYQSVTGLKAGATYAVTCDIMTDATDPLVSTGSESGVRIRVDKGVRLGTGLTYPVYSTVSLLHNEWIKYGSAAFTIPEDFTTEDVAVLSFHLNNATGTAYIDNVVLEEIAVQPSTVATANGDFEVIGNASSIGRPNSWTVSGANVVPGVTMFIDNTDAYSGRYCVRFDAAKNTELYGDVATSKERLALFQDVDGLTAGKTYKVSFAIKVSNTGQQATIRIMDDKGASGVAALKHLTLPTANTWYKLTTYIKPTQTTSSGLVRILFGSYSAHNGDTIWLDDICIEEVTDVSVDFVSADNAMHWNVLTEPKGGETMQAMASVADAANGAKLILAVYGTSGTLPVLKEVKICGEITTGALSVDANLPALLITEAISVPREGGTVKAFVWRADGITPLGEYKVVEAVAAETA